MCGKNQFFACCLGCIVIASYNRACSKGRNQEKTK